MAVSFVDRLFRPTNGHVAVLPARDVPLKPAPVTLGRVSDYFALMVRIGVADLLDEVLSVQVTSEVVSGPVGKLKNKPQERPQEKSEVLMDLGRLYREIGEKGALYELGSIVYGCTEEEARDIPIDSSDDGEGFEAAFFSFALRSNALVNDLVVLGRNSG